MKLAFHRSYASGLFKDMCDSVSHTVLHPCRPKDKNSRVSILILLFAKVDGYVLESTNQLRIVETMLSSAGKINC